MKKLLLLLAFLPLFSAIPSTSFALSDNSQVDLNCYMVTNNSSEQVRYQFQDGQGGWNWNAPEYAYLEIWQIVFFTDPSHNNSYNPRIIDAQGNWYMYVWLDCRDWFRSDPPQAWIDNNAPTPPSCNPVMSWTTIDISSFSSSGACDVWSFSGSTPSLGLYNYSCSTSQPATASCSVTLTTPPDPQNITWYFDSPVVISSGSYNWNLTLHISSGATISNPSAIQIWDHFVVNSATRLDDKIVLYIAQADWQALSVACTTYTATIPTSLLSGDDGISTNNAPITWSFSVVGCPDNSGTGNTNTWTYYSWSTFSGTLEGDFFPFITKDSYGNMFLSQEWLYLIMRNIALFFVLIFTMIVLVKKSFGLFSGKFIKPDKHL